MILLFKLGYLGHDICSYFISEIGKRFSYLGIQLAYCVGLVHPVNTLSTFAYFLNLFYSTILLWVLRYLMCSMNDVRGLHQRCSLYFFSLSVHLSMIFCFLSNQL
jgi:hypothetical protein